MNYRIIAYVIGWVLNLEGICMILPMITGLIYGEDAWVSFLLSGLISALIGTLLVTRKPEKTHFFTKEGCVSVALSWIALSLIGALPFMISGTIPRFVDALFETVSGFTTTGASIMADVEAAPKCILMWRSFTHWIGGMGVLVLLLSIIKMNGGSQMNLMKAESPGPSVSRLTPTVRSTAKTLYTIYIIMTLIEIVILLICGMPVFDALATSFGTAGTGGFGIKNDSMGSYSMSIQIVVTIFMILFGVNFNVYFLLITKKWKQAWKNEEVRWYFLIILVAIFMIAWNIRGNYEHFGVAIQQSAFQVGSIITTTGYATTDFNLWPEVSRTILVMLMFVGACAGSTGGGIKVSRFIILCKAMKKEIKQYIHPRQIRKIRIDGKTVEHEVVRNVNVFMVVYILIFAASVFILAFDNRDLITNFTAVAATFNNIGPGLEMVGPAANFDVFSDVGKYVLIFDMLAGRLEIFPLLLVFFPDTWKKF